MDEEVVCAHLFDIQLSVADVSDHCGVLVAAVAVSSSLSAFVMVLCAATGRGSSVQLISLMCPLLVATYVLVAAAARLNQVRLSDSIR